MSRASLDDLAAFAAVARRRSYRAAAAELGLSPSALSQAVRDLEERLGLRLLHRTTRSVAPTDAGARLLARLGPALAELDAAVDGLGTSDGEVAGLLRINAPAPAVDLVLTPLLGPFLVRYPRVRVEIVVETGFVDIVAEGFDAGVRWEESLDLDMVAVPLSGLQRYVVAAAPALLERLGVPEHPRDLERFPCLMLRFASGQVLRWEFERQGEQVVIHPRGPAVSTHGPLLLELARAGVGLVSSFEGYVTADLQTGRLVPVLEDWSPSFSGPCLYFPGRRQLPAPLRALVEFVRARRAEAASPIAQLPGA